MKQRRGEYKSNKNIINKEIPPKKKKVFWSEENENLCPLLEWNTRCMWRSDIKESKLIIFSLFLI